MSHTVHSLRRALQNQIRRLQHRIDTLNQQTHRLSMSRLGVFLGGLAVIYLVGTYGPEWLFWITVLAFIGGFYRLINVHKGLEQSLKKLKVWKAIRSRHLSRQSLDWPNIPSKSTAESYNTHPYAHDLDIIGEHSLLQLIDTGNYQGSTDVLAELLLQKRPDPAWTGQRQRLVKELKEQPTFRDRLHLLAELHQEQQLEEDWTLEDLRNYLNNAESVNYLTPLFVLGTLALLNIIFGAAYVAGLLDPYFIFTLPAYLFTYNFYSDKAEGLYEESSQIKKQLTRFNAILQFLETYRYREGSKLKEFCRRYWDQSDSPSRYVHKIIRLAGAASSQQSEIIWMIVNLLLPWDLYFTQKLSRYKQELAPRLNQWIDQFYKLEALNSLANFAWLNPKYSFALPNKQSDHPFEATELGHPLIPQNEKVTNNLRIDAKGDLLLITGSNMAGKSTFLRTIGINLALCFSGGPVNASTFSTLPFRLFSSINVTDSLDNGLSHFYAEVKQLRSLMDLLNDDSPMPVFFLVDEIYRGTNNRERLQGSRAFLQKVAGKNGIGLVSTHDLELAQLQETIPELSNWHFAETIEGDKMSFSYKIKPGPCPSTNALKIMQMEGLPT